MESRLVAKVVELLRARRYNISFREISEATEIPSAWIRSLQHGHIKEPSCPRIETLYKYLTGETLEV